MNFNAGGERGTGVTLRWTSIPSRKIGRGGGGGWGGRRNLLLLKSPVAWTTWLTRASVHLVYLWLPDASDYRPLWTPHRPLFPLLICNMQLALFRGKHYQRILYFRLQVVGSQARILYSDQRGRVALAQAFNRAISEGRLQASRVFFWQKYTVRWILNIAI